jgi:hypothetical protein
MTFRDDTIKLSGQSVLPSRNVKIGHRSVLPLPLLLLLRWGESMSLWNWVSNGPFVHPPDDIWVNMEQLWNDIDRGNRRTRRKACPSAALSTANHTWSDMCASPDLHSEKPATNSLSYGTAHFPYHTKISELVCYFPLSVSFSFIWNFQIEWFRTCSGQRIKNSINSEHATSPFTWLTVFVYLLK